MVSVLGHTIRIEIEELELEIRYILKAGYRQSMVRVKVKIRINFYGVTS